MKCPLCHQPVTAEQKPIERDVDGVPYAAATGPGYNIPWADPHSLPYRILLDGEVVHGCVGFDRHAGLVWRYISDGRGSYMLKDDTIAVEQVAGNVTVEPI